MLSQVCRSCMCVVCPSFTLSGADLGEAVDSCRLAITAVALAGDKLEASSVRKVIGGPIPKGCVPDRFECLFSGIAKISVAPNVNSLDTVVAVEWLIAIELDGLELKIDVEPSGSAINHRVQMSVRLEDFVEMVVKAESPTSVKV